jgi:cysteine desulfurase
MWVNNEIGTVQPVEELAATAKSRGALFHTDAVQAFGKIEIDARKVAFDALAISGHKIGAPKGCGAIFIRRGTVLESLFHGGTQERGKRPGTENVAAAIGLAKAAELACAERQREGERLRSLRERLERGIRERVPDAVIHGANAPKRAPHIVNVSVPGTDTESMLMALDLQGIGCSGGSACQSGSASPSHVLSAIGASRDLVGAAIRMSLGSLSDETSVDRVIDVFAKLVAKARNLVPVS